MADDFDGGWDNRVTLVDGRWVDRTPRYPDREPQLRREVALLPWLAPLSAAADPRPRVVSEDPFTVRHAYLPGDACPGTSPAHGAAIGGFLRALHSRDPDEAVHHGARDVGARPTASCRTRWPGWSAECSRCCPTVPTRAGRALLERMATRPTDAAVWCTATSVPSTSGSWASRSVGVIDWGDTLRHRPGAGSRLDGPRDRARRSPRPCVAAYRPDEDLLARARDWHLLGPWHEVLYGLGEGGPEFVDSGLAGIVARLER